MKKIFVCAILIMIMPIAAMCINIGSPIIVDNAQPENISLTGEWETSTSLSGFYGTNYFAATVDGTYKEAAFIINIPEAGRYNVSIYHPVDTSFSKSAEIKIFQKNGVAAKKADIRFNGDRWLSLGVFEFNAGEAKIAFTSTQSSAGEKLIADAVKFQKYSPLPEVDIQFTSLPSTISLNKQFSVSVSAANNLAECGLRGCLTIEARDGEDGSLLGDVFFDNNKEGFTDTVVAQAATFTITKQTPFVYFTAYMSPFGFNNWVINEFESTPIDGTFPYEWVGNGVTHDIYYQSSLILANNSGNKCYCSGITFESFMDAWNSYMSTYGINNIFGLTVTNVKNFRQRWYGTSADYRDCSTNAITYHKCGVRITNLDEVQRGDFIQIWRASGSGHSVIFTDFERDDSGNILKLCYWSTQTSTNGCNYNKENWSSLTSETSFARVAKPHDADDWKNRYSDATSSPSLTRVLGVGEIIIDNTDAGFSSSGSWSVLSESEQLYKTDYAQAPSGNGSSFAKWQLSLPLKGQWAIYEWHPSAEEYTTNAPLTVKHKYGSKTYTLTQQNGGGGWNYIGTFTFAAGGGEASITNACSPDYVVADAIRAVYISDGEISAITIADIILGKIAPSAGQTALLDLNNDSKIDICDLLLSLQN